MLPLQCRHVVVAIDVKEPRYAGTWTQYEVTFDKFFYQRKAFRDNEDASPISNKLAMLVVVTLKPSIGRP